MSLLRRLVPAFRRRVHGPYLALEQLQRALGDVQSRVTNLEQLMVAAAESSFPTREALTNLEQTSRETHELLNGEVRAPAMGLF